MVQTFTPPHDTLAQQGAADLHPLLKRLGKTSYCYADQGRINLSIIAINFSAGATSGVIVVSSIFTQSL